VEPERTFSPLLRGYLYGPTPEAIAQKALQSCPDGAVGGALAANLHKPIRTQAPYPIRFWLPVAFTADQVLAIGLEPTTEGANIELVQAKDDPWRVHRDTTGIPMVSGWRAWNESANATGRTQELADALFLHLKGTDSWM